MASSHWAHGGAARLYPESRSDAGTRACPCAFLAQRKLHSACLSRRGAAMTTPDPRQGMPSPRLTRAEFQSRFLSQFIDPAFAPLSDDLQRLEAAAWNAYSESRKSPRTRRAGDEFSDPDYQLSEDWLAARDAIRKAQQHYEDASSSARILLINGSARRADTTPGAKFPVYS